MDECREETPPSTSENVDAIPLPGEAAAGGSAAGGDAVPQGASSIQAEAEMPCMSMTANLRSTRERKPFGDSKTDVPSIKGLASAPEFRKTTIFARPHLFRDLRRALLSDELDLCTCEGGTHILANPSCSMSHAVARGDIQPALSFIYGETEEPIVNPTDPMFQNGWPVAKNEADEQLYDIKMEQQSDGGDSDECGAEPFIPYSKLDEIQRAKQKVLALEYPAEVKYGSPRPSVPANKISFPQDEPVKATLFGSATDEDNRLPILLPKEIAVLPSSVAVYSVQKDQEGPKAQDGVTQAAVQEEPPADQLGATVHWERDDSPEEPSAEAQTETTSSQTTKKQSCESRDPRLNRQREKASNGAPQEEISSSFENLQSQLAPATKDVLLEDPRLSKHDYCKPGRDLKRARWIPEERLPPGKRWYYAQPALSALEKHDHKDVGCEWCAARAAEKAAKETAAKIKARRSSSLDSNIQSPDDGDVYSLGPQPVPKPPLTSAPVETATTSLTPSTHRIPCKAAVLQLNKPAAKINPSSAASVLAPLPAILSTKPAPTTAIVKHSSRSKACSSVDLVKESASVSKSPITLPSLPNASEMHHCLFQPDPARKPQDHKNNTQTSSKSNKEEITKNPQKTQPDEQKNNKGHKEGQEKSSKSLAVPKEKSKGESVFKKPHPKSDKKSDGRDSSKNSSGDKQEKTSSTRSPSFSDGGGQSKSSHRNSEAEEKSANNDSGSKISSTKNEEHESEKHLMAKKEKKRIAHKPKFTLKTNVTSGKGNAGSYSKDSESSAKPALVTNTASSKKVLAAPEPVLKKYRGSTTGTATSNKSVSSTGEARAKGSETAQSASSLAMAAGNTCQDKSSAKRLLSTLTEPPSSIEKDFGAKENAAPGKEPTATCHDTESKKVIDGVKKNSVKCLGKSLGLQNTQKPTEHKDNPLVDKKASRPSKLSLRKYHSENKSKNTDLAPRDNVAQEAKTTKQPESVSMKRQSLDSVLSEPSPKKQALIAKDAEFPEKIGMQNQNFDVLHSEVGGKKPSRGNRYEEDDDEYEPPSEEDESSAELATTSTSSDESPDNSVREKKKKRIVVRPETDSSDSKEEPAWTPEKKKKKHKKKAKPLPSSSESTVSDSEDQLPPLPATSKPKETTKNPATLSEQRRPMVDSVASTSQHGRNSEPRPSPSIGARHSSLGDGSSSSSDSARNSPVPKKTKRSDSPQSSKSKVSTGKSRRGSNHSKPEGSKKSQSGSRATGPDSDSRSSKAAVTNSATDSATTSSRPQSLSKDDHRPKPKKKCHPSSETSKEKSSRDMVRSRPGSQTSTGGGQRRRTVDQDGQYKSRPQSSSDQGSKSKKRKTSSDSQAPPSQASTFSEPHINGALGEAQEPQALQRGERPPDSPDPKTSSAPVIPDCFELSDDDDVCETEVVGGVCDSLSPITTKDLYDALCFNHTVLSSSDAITTIKGHLVKQERPPIELVEEVEISMDQDEVLDEVEIVGNADNTRKVIECVDLEEDSAPTHLEEPELVTLDDSPPPTSTPSPPPSTPTPPPSSPPPEQIQRNASEPGVAKVTDHHRGTLTELLEASVIPIARAAPREQPSPNIGVPQVPISVIQSVPAPSVACPQPSAPAVLGNFTIRVGDSAEQRTPQTATATPLEEITRARDSVPQEQTAIMQDQSGGVDNSNNRLLVELLKTAPAVPSHAVPLTEPLSDSQRLNQTPVRPITIEREILQGGNQNQEATIASVTQVERPQSRASVIEAVSSRLPALGNAVATAQPRPTVMPERQPPLPQPITNQTAHVPVPQSSPSAPAQVPPVRIRVSTNIFKNPQAPDERQAGENQTTDGPMLRLSPRELLGNQPPERAAPPQVPLTQDRQPDLTFAQRQISVISTAPTSRVATPQLSPRELLGARQIQRAAPPQMIPAQVPHAETAPMPRDNAQVHPLRSASAMPSVPMTRVVSQPVQQHLERSGQREIWHNTGACLSENYPGQQQPAVIPQERPSTVVQRPVQARSTAPVLQPVRPGTSTAVEQPRLPRHPTSLQHTMHPGPPPHAMPPRPSTSAPQMMMNRPFQRVPPRSRDQSEQQPTAQSVQRPSSVVDERQNLLMMRAQHGQEMLEKVNSRKNLERLSKIAHNAVKCVVEESLDKKSKQRIIKIQSLPPTHPDQEQLLKMCDFSPWVKKSMPTTCDHWSAMIDITILACKSENFVLHQFYRNLAHCGLDKVLINYLVAIKNDKRLTLRLPEALEALPVNFVERSNGNVDERQQLNEFIKNYQENNIFPVYCGDARVIIVPKITSPILKALLVAISEKCTRILQDGVPCASTSHTWAEAPAAATTQQVPTARPTVPRPSVATPHQTLQRAQPTDPVPQQTISAPQPQPSASSINELVINTTASFLQQHHTPAVQPQTSLQSTPTPPIQLHVYPQQPPVHQSQMIAAAPVIWWQTLGYVPQTGYAHQPQVALQPAPMHQQAPPLPPQPPPQQPPPPTHSPSITTPARLGTAPPTYDVVVANRAFQEVDSAIQAEQLRQSQTPVSNTLQRQAMIQSAYAANQQQLQPSAWQQQINYHQYRQVPQANTGHNQQPSIVHRPPLLTQDTLSVASPVPNTSSAMTHYPASTEQMAAFGLNMEIASD